MDTQLHETAHRIKLVLQLIFNRGYKYRVEVEQYYLGSGKITMLTFYFFRTFEDAQKFARSYRKPYYRISIFRQNLLDEVLCNIDNGTWATSAALQDVQILHDRFNFDDVIGPDTQGWYLRGLNVHNPIFVEVTEDLEFMLAEMNRRLAYNPNKKTIHKLVEELFDERHPKVGKTYKKSFEQLFMIKNEYRMINLEQSRQLPMGGNQ